MGQPAKETARQVPETHLPERLEAFANSLLLARLVQGSSQPMRAFRVSVEGRTITLALCRLPSDIEQKLWRTPHGRAAIKEWEIGLLTELRPMISETMSNWTGTPVTSLLQVKGWPDTAPALVTTLRANVAITRNTQSGA